MTTESLVIDSKSETIRTQIAVYRKGKYKTEKGWSSRSIKFLWAFEKDNLLTFSISQSADPGFVTSHIFKLKVYKTKSGEQRFIFYKFTGDRFNRIKTCSPQHFANIIRTFSRNNIIPDAHNQRLLKVIYSFVHKHNVCTKYLSKNAIHLLIQLCYPGTIGIDSDILEIISIGSLFRKDPTYSTLRTKGKYSKKLIYQTIKASPYCIQSILRIAKYYRIHRSLDEAQRFLKEYINLIDRLSQRRLASCPFLLHEESFSTIPSRAFFSLPAKTFNFLSKFPSTGRNSILDVIESNQLLYFRDTINMIFEQNLNEGFDISNIQYSNIRELHDALVAIYPRQNFYSNTETQNHKHYEFGKDTMQCIASEILVQNYNNINNEYRKMHDPVSKQLKMYRLVYPKTTDELLGYANEMHNCSFYYKDRIKSNLYIIFCIQEWTGTKFKTAYMFGFTVQNNKSINFKLNFDQAVSYCNKKIEQDLFVYFMSDIYTITNKQKWTSIFTFQLEKQNELNFN